jgi:hypothetical protein
VNGVTTRGERGNAGGTQQIEVGNIDHATGVAVGPDAQSTVIEKARDVYVNVSKEERLDRDHKLTLLDRVREAWIKGVLDRSVHNALLIDLGKESQPSAVANPWDAVLQTADRDSCPLPTGKAIIDIFEDIQRALLILGTPGSGKTITMLQLARDALARAERDPRQPVPVVLNLSSWTDERRAIADWVIDELNAKYQMPRRTTRPWVDNDELFLLLDGLDEVSLERRAACIQALNCFRQEHGLAPIVVCSRTAEYSALANPLQLGGAIALQPLTPAQINSYLFGAGESLATLREALQQDAVLQELAQSPLMISIMALAYRDMLPAQLKPPQLHSVTEQRRQIFELYVGRMLKWRQPDQRFSAAATITWLSWLAQRMAQPGQSTLLIEHMQPRWLRTTSEKRMYAATSWMILAAFVSLLQILMSIVLSYLYGLVVPTAALNFTLLSVTRLLAWPLTLTLLACIYGVLRYDPEKNMIRTVDAITWSWQSARSGSRKGAKYGAYVGLSLLILSAGIEIFSLIDSPPSLPSEREFLGVKSVVILLAFTILFAILGALMGSIIGALFGGWTGKNIATKIQPNQGIRLSAKISVSLFLIGFLILILGLLPIAVDETREPKPSPDYVAQQVELSRTQVQRIGKLLGYDEEHYRESAEATASRPLMPMFLLSGWTGWVPVILLIMVLRMGGAACIRHFVLRSLMVRRGYIPRKLIPFLDYASDRIFLQKVGGGYIFIHRLLLEYFATLEPSHPHGSKRSGRSRRELPAWPRA